MEIRRLEGTLLQHAIEQSQSLKAQRAVKELQLRSLSTVPQVLLETSAGSGDIIRARVSYVEGRSIGLLLPSGAELRAENQSALSLAVGDLLELVVDSQEPLTFRILSLQRINSAQDLLQLLLEEEGKFFISLNPNRLEEILQNSGIFYERKLLELLLGKLKPEELLQDNKAQVLAFLLKEGETLAGLLGQERGESPEDIRNLLNLFRERVLTHQELRAVLRELLLEHMDHREYISFTKTLESRAERGIISALEKKDLPGLLMQLLMKENSGKLGEFPFFEKVLERLRGLQEPALQELLRALETGSEKEIAQAYQRLREALQRGDSLLDFYRTKGQLMEHFLNRLEFITSLQWSMLKYGNAFYFPVYYEGARGGLFFKGGKSYTAVFRLDYGEDFVAGLLLMPEGRKVLDLRLFTSRPEWSQAFRENRALLQKTLEEEGIRLRNLSVELLQKGELPQRVRATLAEEGFLVLA